MVGLVFYFVPNAKVRFRDVWVGAVLTGLLWRARSRSSRATWAICRASALHGSIAAVVVFLFWVYVSAVILLYGVEVTAAYARLRRHRAESHSGRAVAAGMRQSASRQFQSTLPDAVFGTSMCLDRYLSRGAVSAAAPARLGQ